VGRGGREAVFARLLELGATQLEPVTDVGEGIKVAAVRDPFGNRLGIIENPHFKASDVRWRKGPPPTMMAARPPAPGDPRCS